MNGDVSTWKAKGRTTVWCKRYVVMKREPVRAVMIQFSQNFGFISPTCQIFVCTPFYVGRQVGERVGRPPSGRCNGCRNGKGETTGKDPNYESHLARIDTNVDGDIVLSHG